MGRDKIFILLHKMMILEFDKVVVVVAQSPPEDQNKVFIEPRKGKRRGKKIGGKYTYTYKA